MSFLPSFRLRLPLGAPPHKGPRPNWPDDGAPETIFTHIYRTNRWRDKESRSGPGSNLRQTHVIRQALPQVVRELGCKTLLDAPCGDFFWLSRVALDVERYWGVDVVAALVEENQKNYGNEVRHFLKLDLITDPLPKADLVFCRDCLVHFPCADVFRALRNIQASGSTHLLTTTFPDEDTNEEIPMGLWRPLNLQAEPFHLPPPLRLINEGCTHRHSKHPDKSLGLWQLAALGL